MKKWLCICMMLCLLCACGPSKEETPQMITYQPIPQELLEKIQKTMPETIYNELKKNGRSYQLDDTLLVISGTEYLNPALRLDYTYRGDTLIHYVYKPYGNGTFDDQTFLDHLITKEEATQLADNFARAFFNEKRQFRQRGDLSGYDTGDYMTLEDEQGNAYLIQLNRNVILKYIEKER